MAEANNDDIFHDIVMGEQNCQTRGFEEGFLAGQKSGFEEGYRLGWEKGGSIASEIGFYQGFVKELYRKIKDEDDKQRSVKVCQSVLRMIGEISFEDPTDAVLFEKVENIRAKFKQLMSLLGIKADFNSAEDSKGVSF